MSEEQLIRRAQQGDNSAFEQLLLAHQKKVYNLCLRMAANPDDALDLSQEAFIKAWRALGQYQFEASFSTWLFLTRSRGIWCSLRVHTTPPAFPMWGFMWARTGTEAPSCCIVATLSSIQSWTPAIGNPTFTPTGG